MRFIASKFFEESGLLFFPLISIVLFVTFFFVVLVRTFGKRGRGLQAMAELPLAPERESSTAGRQS